MRLRAESAQVLSQAGACHNVFRTILMGLALAVATIGCADHMASQDDMTLWPDDAFPNAELVDEVFREENVETNWDGGPSCTPLRVLRTYSFPEPALLGEIQDWYFVQIFPERAGKEVGERFGTVIDGEVHSIRIRPPDWTRGDIDPPRDMALDVVHVSYSIVPSLEDIPAGCRVLRHDYWGVPY